ncbi:DUF1425 domain-containing protein [Desulforhopalus sp. 52FAK]
MSYKKIALHILSIYLIGLLASCTTVSQPEPNLYTESNQEIIQTRAVDTSHPLLTRVIASDHLIGYISVVNPRIGKTGNFTKAQITIQNLTQNRYSVEYQYQWQDDQGFAVGSPRPWKRFVLAPKEAENIQEMALRPEAVKAIFTVRLPDDAFIELNKQLQSRQ